jgi:hypothetical protein
MKIVRLAPMLLAVLGAGCGSADPEAQIRELLTAAEEAAEARDTGFFRDLLGAGYRDARGNDRDQLLALLRGYFIAHQKIEVVSRIDTVAFEGADAARVVAHAGMVGQRAGESLLGGLDGELYRLQIELVDDGGQWRVISVSWNGAVGE